MARCLAPKNRVRKYPDGHVELDTVSCGRCFNCLKNRQKRYAGRLLKECQKYSEVYFVTLTYRPSCCPFAQCLGYWDKESGSWENIVAPSLCEGDFLDKVRNEYDWHRSEGVSSSMLYEPSWKDFVPDYYIRVTPSLSRRDVSLAIKLFRIRRQRDGCPVNLRYSLFGEYGAHTHRPHYHAIFMNVSYYDVCDFCSIWNERFGFSLVKTIPVKKDDKGVSHARNVALYISKYVSKGVFDEVEVVNGFVEKPRLQQSIGIGAITDSELERLRDYYLCKDIVQYDEYKTIPNVPIAQRNTLYQELLRRMYFMVDGFTFPLPVSWKHLIYYKTVISYESAKNGCEIATKHYQKLPIFKAALSFMASRELSDSFREFKKFIPSEQGDELYSTHLLRFEAYKKNRLEHERYIASKYVLDAFNKSQF